MVIQVVECDGCCWEDLGLSLVYAICGIFNYLFYFSSMNERFDLKRG